MVQPWHIDGRVVVVVVVVVVGCYGLPVISREQDQDGCMKEEQESEDVVQVAQGHGHVRRQAAVGPQQPPSVDTPRPPVEI